MLKFLAFLAIFVSGVSSFSITRLRNQSSQRRVNLECSALKRRDVVNGLISTITSSALVSVYVPYQVEAAVSNKDMMQYSHQSVNMCLIDSM
jgi:hypothetical protein